MRPPRRTTLGATIVAAVMLVAVPRAEVKPPAQGLQATRALTARLLASGRGEADVTLTRSDPLGGPARVERGRLVLEPPARMRIDFARSGERIAVRASGGEWIQPGPKQMLRLSPEQASAVAGLWDVFLRGGGGRFAERKSGEGRYVIEPRDRDSGLPQRIVIHLGPRGLPAAVETEDETEGGSRYEFRAWRFTRPAGERGFVLQAPRGFAVVDLP